MEDPSVPSFQHEFVARVISTLRRGAEVRDPEKLRLAVIASRARESTAPPSARAVRGCEVRTIDGFEFTVYDVTASGATPMRTVLYLHGGGYVGNIDRNHWRYVASLARELGVRVVMPAYPLAPEHTWRDAHPPLLTLFEQLAIMSPRGVTLMGDSAGGGLALSLAQQLVQRPGPQPTHLVLISPWVDLTSTTPGTDEASSRDPWLVMSRMNLYASWWSGGDEHRGRKEVSPLFGSFDGLPPMLVFCGTRDTLLPQVREMVKRSGAARVSVSYHEEAGLLHVYPMLPIPEAKRARRQLAEFL
jgi:epsilon-lactone hydrolase